MTDRLAAFITPGRSLPEAVERVALAEKLGYEAVFTTHIAQRDGLMTLAAYGAGTSRIKLGTGVIPAFPRHPIALAYEAATLDEIIGGRLVLGIGTSHRVTMENWYGLDMSKPLSKLKEYVHILRTALRDGGVEFAGAYYEVSFSFLKYRAREDLPLYISGVSPNTCRFAGEAADGLILWACTPSYIREVVVPAVRAGEEAAGRARGSCEIVAPISAAMTDDPGPARDAFRTDFFMYMNLPFYRKAIAGAGFAEMLERFDAAIAGGDGAGALRSIDDAFVDHFTAIGSAERLRAKIAEYRDAGVTLPAVGLVSRGHDHEATLEAAARG